MLFQQSATRCKPVLKLSENSVIQFENASLRNSSSALILSKTVCTCDVNKLIFEFAFKTGLQQTVFVCSVASSVMIAISELSVFKRRVL